MPHSPRPQRSFRKLVWHGMMGTTLGIVFAGLVLQSGELQAKGLINGPPTHALALRILLTAAFVFGVGATLTGSIFLASDGS